MEKHVVQPLLYHTVHFMTWIGLNPFKQNVISKLLSAYTVLSLLFMVTFILFGAMVNWQGVESVSDLIFVPAILMSCAKWLCLTVNNRKLFKIITGIKRNWPLDKFGTEIEERVGRPHRLVFKVFKLYASFTYVLCLLAWMGTVLDDEPKMLFPIYEICNFQDAMCFYSISFFEIFTVWWSLDVLVMVFESVFLSLCCHAYVAMEMVKIGFTEMVLTHNQKITQDLKDLINQHNYVLSFVEDMNEIYSKMLLVQFWGSLGSIIFSLYMLIAASSIPLMTRISNYGMFNLFWIAQLSMYSITGTYVSNQSTSIGNAAYDVDWFSKTDVELRNALSMIIMRSRKPAKISVGGMVDLNLSSFLDVIRNAMSVSALLKTVSLNDNK